MHAVGASSCCYRQRFEELCQPCLGAKPCAQYSQPCRHGVREGLRGPHPWGQRVVLVTDGAGIKGFGYFWQMQSLTFMHFTAARLWGMVLWRAAHALNTQKSLKESDRWKQAVLLPAPMEELSQNSELPGAGLLLNYK